MDWYIPSWHGDFRLLADDDERSKLEIVDPTPGEQSALKTFLMRARKKGWTSCRKLGLAGKERRQVIALKAPVAETGALLTEVLKPGKQTIVAVRCEGGQLEVAEAVEADKVAALTAPEKKPEKAVSTKRPTPCCPACVPGAVDRASEVLLSFLTEEQHAEWAAQRTLSVIGGLSGHRYLLAHRHSELAAGWGRICCDYDDGGILHFHDWSVPPEEEVLAAKLILEHREPWLRNEATCLFDNGGPWTDVFKNPFGDVMDGTADAAFTSAIGGALLGLTGRIPTS
jgi:hypothetical protein